MELRRRDLDVTWIVEQDRGEEDPDVLRRATQAERTVLTLDNDFGELVFERKLPAPAGVILFRARREEEHSITEWLLLVITSGLELRNTFVTVTNDGIRSRPVPNTNRAPTP